MSSVPAGPEGTPNALTPEIISHIGETELLTPKQQGAYYTPFETARLLARETLCAWLTGQGFSPNLPDLSAHQRQQLAQRLSQLTVCDPACGAGGLVVPCWLELAAWHKILTPAKKQGELLLDILKKNLYANDIRPQAVADLRLRCALTLLANNQPLPGFHSFFTHDALAGHTHPVWHEICPEVFNRGGFDIYLANPPYIGQKNHKAIFNTLRQNPRWTPWVEPKSDLLYFFFHLAFDLLRPDGVAGMLTTTYFAQALGARALRQRLARQATLLRLIDFEDTRLFSRAKGQHNLITVFTPQPHPQQRCTCGQPPVQHPQTALFSGPQGILHTRLPDTEIQAALSCMANSKYTLQELAAVSNGLMTGCDRAFILPEEEKKKLSLSLREQQKLKPFFKNSDISPYTARQTPRRWLIDFFFPQDRRTDVTQYPQLLTHLARFKTQLLARKQNNNGIDKQLAAGKYWFGSVRRRMNFEGEKLVVPHRANTNTFAYTNGPWYASSDVYFITAPKPGVSLWYLLALFNSAPYYAWLYYKGKRKGRLLELYSAPLNELPVPTASPAVQRKLENLAQTVCRLKSAGKQTDIYQARIDKQVCTLFHFTASQTQAILSDFHQKQPQMNRK